MDIADMAQLVEQRIRNAWVAGSSPVYRSSCKITDEKKKVIEKFAEVK